MLKQKNVILDIFIYQKELDSLFVVLSECSLQFLMKPVLKRTQYDFLQSAAISSVIFPEQSLYKLKML